MSFRRLPFSNPRSSNPMSFRRLPFSNPLIFYTPKIAQDMRGDASLAPFGSPTPHRHESRHSHLLCTTSASSVVAPICSTPPSGAEPPQMRVPRWRRSLMALSAAISLQQRSRRPLNLYQLGGHASDASCIWTRDPYPTRQDSCARNVHAHPRHHAILRLVGVQRQLHSARRSSCRRRSRIMWRGSRVGQVSVWGPRSRWEVRKVNVCVQEP